MDDTTPRLRRWPYRLVEALGLVALLWGRAASAWARPLAPPR